MAAERKFFVFIANNMLDKLLVKLYYNYRRICIAFLGATAIEKI